MTSPSDAARIRAQGIARRKAEARLAAISPEVASLARQLDALADGISVEALQPKALGGKLQRIANSLRAVVEGQ